MVGFRGSTEEKFPSEISCLGYRKAVTEKRYRTLWAPSFCITKNQERQAFAGALQRPTLQFALALGGGGDCGLKRLFTFRRLAST
jgi:hypothetical protein